MQPDIPILNGNYWIKYCFLDYQNYCELLLMRSQSLDYHTPDNEPLRNFYRQEELYSKVVRYLYHFNGLEKTSASCWQVDHLFTNWNYDWYYRLWSQKKF